MFRYSVVLLCSVLVISEVTLINAKKSFGGGSNRHTYPHSSGHSGGGHGGSGSLSGGGSYGNQPNHGLSGGGHSGNHRNPPVGGNQNTGHGYPPQNSGSHTYPSDRLSGSSNNHGYPGGKVNSPTGGTTNIHHHYHYSPPQQIHYPSSHGGAPMNYPVYRGTPPTYVYKYKDSGSKYGTLLAGLALFNLGALAGGVYGHSHSHSNNYEPKKGEVCLFGVKKDNGDYEETRIDCQMITSFIYQEQEKPQNQPTNTSVVTTITTNTTIVNTTNPAPGMPQVPGAVNVNVNFTMLPNGTLIPVNVSSMAVTGAGSPPPASGEASSVSITSVSNTTTIVSALDVKGKPISVTPGMQCYVIRKIPSASVMKRTVPCGLLQTYADKSLKPNSGTRNVPAFTILAVMCAVFVMY